MIYYSKVYRNQATVIPKEIKTKKNNKTNDIIKWTININYKEITVDILPKEEVKQELYDKIIRTEDYIYVYRNISKRRHITLPAEVENLLNFSYKKHLIKWTVKDGKIRIEKSCKESLLSISGILKKEGGENDGENTY